jgi:hypothetical protein
MRRRGSTASPTPPTTALRLYGREIILSIGIVTGLSRIAVGGRVVETV